jgi:hypothetical protein
MSALSVAYRRRTPGRIGTSAGDAGTSFPDAQERTQLSRSRRTVAIDEVN